MRGQKRYVEKHCSLLSLVWAHVDSALYKKATDHCRMHQPTARQRNPALHDRDWLHFGHVTDELRCSLKQETTGPTSALSTWSPVSTRSSYLLFTKPISTSFDRFPMLYFSKNNKYGECSEIITSKRKQIYPSRATPCSNLDCKFTYDLIRHDLRWRVKRLELPWLTCNTQVKLAYL